MPLPFGEATVTKDRGGTGRSEREKRGRAGLGCCAAGCSRAVVGDWAGPLAGLVASRAGFSLFFFETFSFSFLVFCRVRKRKVFGVILLWN